MVNVVLPLVGTSIDGDRAAPNSYVIDAVVGAMDINNPLDVPPHCCSIGEAASALCLYAPVNRIVNSGLLV